VEEGREHLEVIIRQRQAPLMFSKSERFPDLKGAPLPSLFSPLSHSRVCFHVAMTVFTRFYAHTTPFVGTVANKRVFFVSRWWLPQIRRRSRSQHLSCGGKTDTRTHHVLYYEALWFTRWYAPVLGLSWSQLLPRRFAIVAPFHASPFACLFPRPSSSNPSLFVR